MFLVLGFANGIAQGFGDAPRDVAAIPGACEIEYHRVLLYLRFSIA